MRVLGIDPGTVRMGYALLDSHHSQNVADAVDYGVVALKSSIPIEDRLYQLFTHVVNMIGIFQPDAMAVEEPFVGRGENQFSGPALAVGQAQAVALIAAAGQAVPIFRYSPSQVKVAVADHGRATKEQVQNMVRMLLGLESEPEPSDAADALAIALCHLRRREADEVMSREIR